MHLMLLLLSVATVASGQPSAQVCDGGGTRIGSMTLEAPQACRASRDRRIKACASRGCGRTD